MVPMNVITVAAHKETARQAILKQLKDYGATSRQMPGSLEIGSDEAQAALADLLAAGQVREARAGLYYLDESKVKPSNPGNGLIALVAIIIILSVTASVIALVTSAA